MSWGISGLAEYLLTHCCSPYRFETPWRAFEFAYHIQAVEANLVIVTMAWLTREDGHHFTRMPEEPDTETLTYWYARYLLPSRLSSYCHKWLDHVRVIHMVYRTLLHLTGALVDISSQ